jgi:prepilin-type N-terminal cleavage/methylation domain-containing protein
MNLLPPTTYNLKPKHGFTLIELLVVIAIIGILAAIGLANFMTAQKQARDASRRETIANIQTAFEQYYAATGGYPTDMTAAASAFDNGSVPKDPQDPNSALTWTLGLSTYCVCATLETSTGNASNTSCTWSSTGTNYCAQNKQ